MLEMLRKIKVIDGVLAGGIFLVAVGIGVSIKENKATKSKVEVVSKPTIVETKDISQVNSKVMIDIEGEVIHPGIYELKKGDRVGDVLVLTGGLGAGADRDWVDQNLNRAELLIDGEKIYIPKAGESYKVVSLSSSSSALVNINAANAEELDKLDGIGPSLANRIIDYRVKNGGFKTLDEIKLVSGIGDKLFEKIKDEISI
jgi:competence protein ComEA